MLENYEPLFSSRAYQEPQLKPDKGKKNGSCNRKACQQPHAQYFNKGTRKYYCWECAQLINTSCGEEICYLEKGEEDVQ